MTYPPCRTEFASPYPGHPEYSGYPREPASSFRYPHVANPSNASGATPQRCSEAGSSPH